MAESPSDNELNFSDYENSDSDGEEGEVRPPTSSVIAHKEMKTVQISDAEEDSDKDDSDRDESDKEESPPDIERDKGGYPQELEFEAISPASENSDDDSNKNENKLEISSFPLTEETAIKPFEPISPVSDGDNNFETISPPESPVDVSQSSSHITNPQFENISDDEEEEDTKQAEVPVKGGKFIPIQENDDLNFNDESSNESGYNVTPPEDIKVDDTVDITEINEILPEEGKELPEEIEEDVVEAPIPDEIEEDEIEVPMPDEIEEDHIEAPIPDETDGDHIEAPIPDETEEDDIEAPIPEDIEEDDIEAPMPSPFSDIGDLDDITEYHGEIISDILKDTDATEQQFEFNKDSEDEEEEEEGEEGAGSEMTASKETDELEQDNEDEDDVLKQNEPEKKESRRRRVISSDEEEEEEEVSASEGKNNEDVAVPEPESEDKSEDNHKKEEEPVSKIDDGEKSGDKEEEKKEEEEGEDAGDLIADIFGESDEEEEFEGFSDEDLAPEAEEKEPSDKEDEPVYEAPRREEKRVESDDDDMPVPKKEYFVNDFEVMMENKKAERKAKRRTKKDGEMIGDNDEIIAAMIARMKEAADEDRMLNQAGKAATKKLRMLQSVAKSLAKADLQGAFIDCGVLSAMKEWLSPLPDHALPHIHIRKQFLIILHEFPPLNKISLKSSGIGRAVMLLFKHPKETRENKQMAAKIISNWARPIFNVSTNYLDMTREEREDRDKASLKDSKGRRESIEEVEPKRTKLEKEEDENKPRKPGDKGWCARARVPQPSNRDYVNRPNSKLDAYEQTRSLNTKKPLSRYEKHALKMKGKKGTKMKAMEISLSGSKLGL